MVSADAARARSEEEWLHDLAQLRLEAKERFGDVAWVAEGSDRLVHAHKCIVYARATGNWQQRFMGIPHSLSGTEASSYGHSTTSLRTWTPQSLVRRDSTATQNLVPSPSPVPSDLSRSSTSSSSIRPIVLGSTDLDVFETSLEYFYTGGREAEAFAVVLEGFSEGGAPADGELTGVAKLRQDLHFCWRSKLFADVDLVLESPDGTLSVPFSAHRAILASRSSYFKSLLLGDYSDSSHERFTLPSPPFSPPSLIFVLGYMYTGTLDFSNRTFNLETVFETWRCAAFLSMSTLQDELEVKIVSMSTPQRAPRIYQFAHAPDVNSALLAKTTLPIIVDHFDEMWATPYIGTLDYDPQMQLVSKLRSLITPLTVVKISRQTRRLRKKIELERSGWISNVESMVEAIEKRLVSIIANQLPEIVASPGFIDLVDGVGFSSDVLEWVLLQVFNKDELQEKNAPLAYQALVGSVLLREQGIMVDARMHVEDTRNGLLKYIKSRWAIIRDGGGFDALEPWCLKELADELEITTKELLAGERPAANRRSPPKRLTEKPVAQVRPRASEPLEVRQVVPVVPRQSLPTRAPRLSTASTVSRTSLASTAPRATATRTPAATSAASRAPPPIRSPAVSTASRTTVASTTPRPSGRPQTTSQPSAPPSSAPSVRPRIRTQSAASSATPAPRKPPSPSPSTTTVRSASVRPSPAATPRAIHPRNTPNPSAARQSPVPRASSSSSITPRSRTTSGPPATAPAQVRKQASSTSLRSTTSSKSIVARPPSATLQRSRAASAASTRRPSNASTKPPLPTSTSRTSVRQTTGSSRTVPTVPPLPSSSSAILRSKPRTSRPKPPGTSLLSGIPCIVTVKGTRPIRMRATVRYLGSLAGESGQWIGVEVPEETIPVEAKKLSWNDGKKGEVEYFSLTPPSTAPTSTSSAPSTSPSSPVPSDRPVPVRQDSLQPPTVGRQPRRRSTSSEPTLPTGPTKGLFVRPSQIVYVL